MNNLIKDVSTLSNVSEDLLNKLLYIAQLNIGQCIFESIIERKNPAEIDIGIGILYIKYEDDNVKYKFIPSLELEEEVNQVLESRKKPVLNKLVGSLNSRIQAAYKDFI